jgi:hypothetical protein
MNVIKTPLTLGHIEIRRNDGSPDQHVTGWFDIEQLSHSPIWIQSIAQKMALMFAHRAQKKLETVVLSSDSYRAGVFGAMLAAKLGEDERFNNIQTALMHVSTDTQRHHVTMNRKAYLEAERIVIADLASFTLGTLQQLLRHVKNDRFGTKPPEIIIMCGLRLCRSGIDPSTSTLSGATVCIGYEHILDQSTKGKRCKQCTEEREITHVFDPKKGFRIFDKEKERKEAEQQAEKIRAARQLDDDYQARRAAGEPNLKPPMKPLNS